MKNRKNSTDKEKKPEDFQPQRISSYFRKECLVLLAVTVSGLGYNSALLANPWFGGQLT